MSINIFGNFSIKNIKVVNSDTKQANVPVDIPSYLNRKTEAKTLKSYIAARGGCFDLGLWQPPLVAELPNGDRYLFDGDHRRALWRHAYPNKKSMPAQIVPVPNKEEISRLFVAQNKTARKALKSNEVFVHEVRGNLPHALNIEKQLEDCLLSVSLGTKAQGDTVGQTGAPEVSIAGFKSAINKSDLNSMVKSSTEIQRLWPDDKRVQVELLSGLARIYKNTQFGKYKGDFQNFLSDQKNAFPTQKDLATHFKQKGGSIVNHHDSCVALGTLIRFKGYVTGKKVMSPATFKKHFGAYKSELENKVNS
tara:strand:- start:17 stop:937 length:921 start_codon:yes stop_codon:yes gene_type:complete